MILAFLCIFLNVFQTTNKNLSSNLLRLTAPTLIQCEQPVFFCGSKHNL